MKRKRKTISYTHYKRIIHSNKSLRRAISTLRSQVLEMKHYWKIRRRERRVYANGKDKLWEKVVSLEALRKQLEVIYRHKMVIKTGEHIAEQGQRRYPLFISRNELLRLRGFLKRNYQRHKSRRALKEARKRKK